MKVQVFWGVLVCCTSSSRRLQRSLYLQLEGLIVRLLYLEYEDTTIFRNVENY
jgi:hypothetical protein